MEIVKVDHPEAAASTTDDRRRPQKSLLVVIYGMISLLMIPFLVFVTLIKGAGFAHSLALSCVGLLVSSAGMHTLRLKDGKKDIAIGLFFGGMIFYFFLHVLSSIGFWIRVAEDNRDFQKMGLYLFKATPFSLLIPMISLAFVKNDNDCAIFQTPKWNMVIALSFIILGTILFLFCSTGKEGDPMVHVLYAGYFTALIMMSYATFFTPFMYQQHLSLKFNDDVMRNGGEESEALILHA